MTRSDRMRKLNIKITVKAVKCIKPSSGLDEEYKILSGIVGGLVGEAASVVGTAATGGLLIATIAFGGVAGAYSGYGYAEKTDKYFSGTDDLYIKLDGKKVWPKDSDAYSIESQKEVHPEISINLTSFKTKATITLWDRDSVSNDDELGYLTFHNDHKLGTYMYCVESKTHGSMYFVTVSAERVIDI